MKEAAVGEISNEIIFKPRTHQSGQIPSSALLPDIQALETDSIGSDFEK